MTLHTCPKCGRSEPEVDFPEWKGNTSHACRGCRYAQINAWKRRQRASRISGEPKKMKPWSVAVYDFLRDGEWHSYREVVEVAAAIVPPGVALRAATKRRQTRSRGGKQWDLGDDHLIWLGQRMLARSSIYTLLQNHLERRGVKPDIEVRMRPR